ncbi:MAG TPA: hypothetical protein VFB14_00635 [Bryobacteraceae bacterium]|nr:hypothetical protein [Bryobacteraceae bacterium]
MKLLRFAIPFGIALCLSAQPAPTSGRGVVRQLNYDRGGAVNGFVLDNGTLVFVPPFDSGNPSAIRPGARVQYSGNARQTPAGRTVVDVQSITVNGQTLTLAAAPPPPARPGRGPRGVAPPPPPPSSPNPPPPPPQ